MGAVTVLGGIWEIVSSRVSVACRMRTLHRPDPQPRLVRSFVSGVRRLDRRAVCRIGHRDPAGGVAVESSAVLATGATKVGIVTERMVPPSGSVRPARCRGGSFLPAGRGGAAPAGDRHVRDLRAVRPAHERLAARSAAVTCVCCAARGSR